MNELKHIVEDIQTVFAENTYPQDFLAAYDQMECLASHTGKETFLVRRRADGEMAVAACYNVSVFPLAPDIALLKELDHPGLPRYYEQYRNETMLCIVREYIEGVSLGELALERRLSLETVVSIAKQLCDILETLHTHQPPVVHRDIKPENIIVKPDGRIVLIDFDIARTFRNGSSRDTVFFGTRGYAPPEQYGFGQTDVRADIYAFGVLIRWMVTGSERENPNIVINDRIQKLIDRCTAFSPEDRYRDIRQVRGELDKVSGKNRRMIRPKLAAWMLLGGILLTVCGFAAGRYTDLLRKPEKTVFQEPLIEQAVRMQTGKEKGTLTPEELEAVSRLYIYGTQAFSDPEEFYQCTIDTSTEGPVHTLDDLVLLPNLEEIHMVHQEYVNVSAVTKLPKLQTLELKHMKLSGAEPLGDVPRLRNAILFCTDLNDVKPLESCPWLETLDIGLNNITTMAQIGTHPNVRSLGLMWLEMDNVDGIAQQLPKVQAVTLQHGNIRDLSGLKELPDLEAVYVLEEQVDAVRKLFEGTDVEIYITEN